jgi:hypothetical protein
MVKLSRLGVTSSCSGLHPRPSQAIYVPPNLTQRFMLFRGLGIRTSSHHPKRRAHELRHASRTHPDWFRFRAFYCKLCCGHGWQCRHSGYHGAGGGFSSALPVPAHTMGMHRQQGGSHHQVTNSDLSWAASLRFTRKGKQLLCLSHHKLHFLQHVTGHCTLHWSSFHVGSSAIIPASSYIHVARTCDHATGQPARARAASTSRIGSTTAASFHKKPAASTVGCYATLVISVCLSS